MEWLASIQRIRALKLDLARLDPYAGMPVAPPSGACEEAIAGAERRLGFRLPPSYRAMLSVHDGWPHLFAGASLLGVRALSRGTFVDVARMVLEDHELPERGAAAVPGRRKGPRAARLVPFGIDAEAEILFAWDTAAPRPDGELDVVMWINAVGERAAGFPAFLGLLVEMLEAELDERRAARAPRERVELTPTPRSARVSEPPRSGVRPARRPRIAAPAIPVRAVSVG